MNDVDFVKQACEEIRMVEGDIEVYVEGMRDNELIAQANGKLYKATMTMKMERFEKTGEWIV